ncbi:MAG: SDR family oxidoreductase [Candidatus Sungbacteria bacterium]|nr:SDR family oxidoreductase [Candidatus Sungbacteria bacterium]
MRKKIFIIGLGGLTGSKLAIMAQNDYEVFGSYNLRNPEFTFVKSVKLDISNVPELQKALSEIHPDILINASGINSVDYCESHQDEARRIHIDAVKCISEIADSLGAKFVHLSSDSVFDGMKDAPYTEKDRPNPINFYGHTKLAGEKIVLKNSKNLVVRASVLYGWLLKQLSNLPSSSMKPSNFGQWLITKLISGEKVKIIADEYDSPIIADDFARSILHLVKNNQAGVFHSAPPIRITRYDFSIKLAHILGLNSGLIQPVSNKELGRIITTGFNKCLDSNKIKRTGFKFLSLEESLNLLKKQVFST